MDMTFRWYGKEFEKINLEDIRQIPNVQGIVGTLMDIPAGEVWPEDRIKDLKEEVEFAGMHLKVIESVNVHDDIKIGLPTRDKYIKNYIQTIRNLAKYGVEVICYNFMPIFDWAKSDLNYKLADGSHALAYIDADIPDDPQVIINQVKKEADRLVLPGWEPERLADIERLFEAYKDVDEEKLRENLLYFLEKIIPVCEEVGIKMGIHPDDPPYSIYGLPRIMKDVHDLRWLCDTIDSPANGITFCTGSMAEDPDNDVYAMLAEFCARDRVPFAHLRNIQFINGSKDFHESAHPSNYGYLDMYQVMETMYKNGFDGYIRPDHGRMIWGETGRPGYGLYDRALATAYLNGLWEAISKNNS